MTGGLQVTVIVSGSVGVLASAAGLFWAFVALVRRDRRRLRQAVGLAAVAGAIAVFGGLLLSDPLLTAAAGAGLALAGGASWLLSRRAGPGPWW